MYYLHIIWNTRSSVPNNVWVVHSGVSKGPECCNTYVCVSNYTFLDNSENGSKKLFDESPLRRRNPLFSWLKEGMNL